ncbi:hypothetical protein HanIR_Chr15g0777321 [Helianthus annuus]|nr:hypothetical protein HanIR_Chr15g0777321 [Helianthus annuus]
MKVKSDTSVLLPITICSPLITGVVRTTTVGMSSVPTNTESVLVPKIPVTVLVYEGKKR